jgi:hypothetical protein
VAVSGIAGEHVLDGYDSTAIVLEHVTIAERAEQRDVGNQATAGRRECRL